MSNIKVAIFEDNVSWRNMLFQLIDGSENFQCVGAFPDCNNLIKNIEKVNPDVVMMDIGLPEINGIEGAKLLKKRFPEIKILMQTIFDDSEKIFQSICAGASGYILKNTSPSRVLQSIVETYEGGAPLSPSIALKILTMVKIPEGRTIKADFNLTEREKEILKYLVDGLSYKQIANESFISIYTIKFHIQNIYEKLHVHSKSEAVVKAIKKNIV
jgi:DNA-binding NarL/FixJ family response regulator